MTKPLKYIKIISKKAGYIMKDQGSVESGDFPDRKPNNFGNKNQKVVYQLCL